MGGESPRALDVIAEHGDAYVMHGDPPEVIADRVRRISELPGGAGRPPLRFGVSGYVIVRDTEAEAQAELDRVLDVRSEPGGVRVVPGLREGLAAGVGAVAARSTACPTAGCGPGWSARRSRSPTGSRAYEEAGVGLMLLQFSPQAEEMARFGAQVIPLLPLTTRACADRWSRRPGAPGRVPRMSPDGECASPSSSAAAAPSTRSPASPRGASSRRSTPRVRGGAGRHHPQGRLGDHLGRPGDAADLRRELPTVENGTAVVLPGDPTAGGLVVVEPGDGRQGAARGGRGLPGAARAVRRGRDDPGPAGDGRRAVRGLRRARQRRGDGQGVHRRSCWPPRACRSGRTRWSGPARSLAAADRDRLGLPAFVKPARGGSSIGISRVDDWAELPGGHRDGPGGGRKVLVEAAVPGREIELAVLEGLDGAAPDVSVPAEILLPAADWYDFEAKYLDDVSALAIPADLPADVTARLRELAARAFTALDCAGLARVDFFVGPGGRDHGQRGEHDAGLHADLGVPAGVGGVRARLPGPARPPDPAPRWPRGPLAALLRRVEGAGLRGRR